MTHPTTIRPIARTDHAEWLPLWNGYNAFYERIGPTALDPAITAALFERLFDPSEPVHALVAERDGRLIGLVHYLYHRSTTMIGPTCYLQDLFTAPEARGGGVGKALIEGVYAAARAAGAGRVYWLTHHTNPARKLYDQVADDSGFVVYRKLF